jgi:hypothetical protein
MIELPCKIRKKAIHGQILVSNVAKQQNKTTRDDPYMTTFNPLPHCRPDPAGPAPLAQNADRKFDGITQRDGRWKCAPAMAST